MTEFLCMLAALGNGLISMMTVNMAADQKKEEKREEEQKAPSFPHQDEHPVIKDPVYVPEKRKDTSMEETKEDDPVIRWCSENIGLLIDIESRSGEHLIEKEKYDSLSKEDVIRLKDLLFSQMTDLEGIQELEDGLMLIRR